jgi:hypothetical protein
MILLQTLSRLHVCATLAAAQLIGSCVVMIARATSPSKVGPGNVFPNPAIWNPSTGENNPFVHWEFWLALACQIVIVFGYFFFFRKEQLVRKILVGYSIRRVKADQAEQALVRHMRDEKKGRRRLGRGGRLRRVDLESKVEERRDAEGNDSK